MIDSVAVATVLDEFVVRSVDDEAMEDMVKVAAVLESASASKEKVVACGLADDSEENVSLYSSRLTLLRMFCPVLTHTLI